MYGHIAVGMKRVLETAEREEGCAVGRGGGRAAKYIGNRCSVESKNWID
jgi:hypothetical protein